LQNSEEPNLYSFGLKKAWTRISDSFLKMAKKDFTVYNGVVLPLKSLRTGGWHFYQDKDFFDSGVKEVNRLVERLGLESGTKLLDIGCGVGRLAIGILNTSVKVDEYYGLDVNKTKIQWCQKYIQNNYPNFKFQHINVKNERYNPSGSFTQSEFKLPLSGSYDIIYLYSVFSHLLKDDVHAYLSEFSRLLGSNGNIFLTAFVEEDSEDMTVNPEKYKTQWRGPLHCVRYDKNYFETILRKHNFVITKFEYGIGEFGQSAYYLSRE